MNSLPRLSLTLSTNPPDMSVLIETSLGDLVVDLEIDSCPRVCENFLKLCKIKYYGLNAFFNGKSLLPPHTQSYSR
jgi:hypothetical protein